MGLWTAQATSNKVCFQNGQIPASFLFIFVLFSFQQTITVSISTIPINWKRIDGLLGIRSRGKQDGRRRQNFGRPNYLSFYLSAENVNFFLKPFKSQDDFSDCLASSKSNLGKKLSKTIFFKFVRGVKLLFFKKINTVTILLFLFCQTILIIFFQILGTRKLKFRTYVVCNSLCQYLIYTCLSLCSWI